MMEADSARQDLGRHTGGGSRKRRNLELMKRARVCLAEVVQETFKGEVDGVGWVLRLAQGRYKSDPFAAEHYSRMRDEVMKLYGLQGKDRRMVEGQVLRLRMISAVLKGAGGPDWKYLLALENGVPIGVDWTMPRTPEVFEAKPKWKFDEAPPTSYVSGTTTAQWRSAWRRSRSSSRTSAPMG